MTPQDLLEREEETARLAQVLDDATAGHGSVVAIEAGAGLGKSALLGWCRRAAETRQLRVLRATAVDAERAYPFGVVRQLFEPVVAGLTQGERDALLAGVVAPARALTDVRAEPPTSPREAAAYFHALYWLAAELTCSRAGVLLVDDVQWADEESAAFLGYLGRRTADLSLALVVASRPREPDASPALTDLRHLAALELRPGELSEGGVAAVVENGLGAVPEPAFVTACRHVTGGNPFYVRELVRVLRDGQVRPTADAAGHVASARSRDLTRSILLRLARLGADAAALARAVAVLGDGADLRQAAAVAELGGSAAGEAADALARAGILQAGATLAFAHPIVRGAVEGDVQGAGRAEAHTRAASVRLAAGMRPEVVARHLLETGRLGSRDAAVTLRDAAHRVLGLGGAATALRYLERALLEPVEPPLRRRLHLEAGIAARVAGDAGASMRHLEEAYALCEDGPDTVQVALELAHALHIAGRFADALSLLTAAIDRAGAAGDALTLTAGLAALALSAGRFDLCAERLEALAPTLTGATATERELLVYLATVRLAAGSRARQVTHLVRQAVDGGLVAEATADRPPVTWASYWLLLADELDLALAVGDEALADACRRGSVLGRGVAGTLRAQALLARGDVPAAADEAAQAYDAVRAAGWQVGLLLTVGTLAGALLEQGRSADLLALVEEYRDDTTTPRAVLDLAHARLLLARGEGEAALALLGPIRRYALGMGSAWVGAYVAALHAAGRGHEAVPVVQDVVDDPYAAPRAVAGVLRAHASALGPARGLPLCERSVAAVADTPARLDHAYSLVALGELLRRAGTRGRAQEVLREGLDVATRCGASALAERARQELLSSGARPRRDVVRGVAALTATERRVAELAAQGLTNPAIAQALFVSRKTVEKHLGRAYAKLAVTSRDRLADVLDEAQL